jgi:O-antigen/teichoic acid export membrane protein
VAEPPAAQEGATVSARRPLTLSFGASVVIQGINVLTGMALARSLGPHGRGELAAVLLWPNVLATIGSLGVTEAMTYHAARSTCSAGTLVGSGLIIALVQSAVCVAVGAAILPLVLGHYGAATVHAAYLFLAFIPATLVLVSLLAVLNGLQRFVQFHVLRLLVFVVTGGAFLVLRLEHDLTIWNAAVVYLSATSLSVAAAAVLLAPDVWRSLRFSTRLSRGLLGYGLRSHTGNVTWMMNERLDQLVISIFLAPIQLGLYVTAVTMTSLTNLVGQSVATAAFPVVARMEPGDERRDRVRHLVQLALAGSIATSVPLIIVTPQLIHVFFKDAYLDAVDVTRVLLVAAVLLSVNRALGACLRALGRPLDAGIPEFLALGVTVVGLAVLLPFLGMMGAGIVSLLAYAVSTGWMLRRVAKVLDMPVWSLVLIDRADLHTLVQQLSPSRWRVAPATTAGEERSA